MHCFTPCGTFISCMHIKATSCQPRARAASGEHQATLQATGQLEAITDVNADAVAATLRRFGVSRMVHGHTHRPAIHALDLAGQRAQRIVLGDWYEQGSVLRVDASGIALESLAFA